MFCRPEGERRGYETLTRVTGGAFSPAPSPDGNSLFFLELTARGIDLRRLPLPTKPLAASNSDPAGTRSPILPPAPAPESRPLRLSPVGSPRPYSALQTQVLRLASGFTVGPDGNSFQLGVEGSDVVGRFRWAALGAAGNAAGPRGGSIAGAWLGLPAELRLQIFSALEKPGSQHLVSRPELDEEGVGGFASASWGRPFFWGGVRVEAGGGWTRVDPQDNQPDFDRALGSVQARANFRRTRGESGVALDLDLAGSFGETAGASWSQLLAGARLSGITSVVTLALGARAGDTGGSPTRFDLFALGGASSAILPPGLDRNRVESPALPAAVQLGERFELTAPSCLPPVLPSFSTPSGCAPGAPAPRSPTGSVWRGSRYGWSASSRRPHRPALFYSVSRASAAGAALRLDARIRGTARPALTLLNRNSGSGPRRSSSRRARRTSRRPSRNPVPAARCSGTCVSPGLSGANPTAAFRESAG